MTTADFLIENYGSIYLVRPVTAEASEWLHATAPDAQWLGNSLAVEHRYITDVIAAIQDAGFVI